MAIWLYGCRYVCAHGFMCMMRCVFSTVPQKIERFNNMLNNKHQPYSIMINPQAITIKVQTLVQNGRHEVTTKEELEKYPIGSLVAFITKSGVLRVGGFITKFKKLYFVYVKDDFEKTWRGRYEKIDKIYVGDVYSTYNDIVSITEPKNRKTTNFPVTLNNAVVYHGKNNYDVKRFMLTDRYLNMIKWNEYFEKNDNNK